MESIMKERFCLNCGHRLKNGEHVCPKCSFDNDAEKVEKMEIHAFKRLCYAEVTRSRERKDKALAFYVIAGILLVLGIVFFVLSFRYDVLRQRHFTPASTEFVFSVLSFAGFLVFGVIASVWLIPSLRRKKYFENQIRKRK